MYMLSGSVALSAYTVPRYTRDVDIVVELKSDDVNSLAQIFAHSFYFHRPSVEEEVQRKGMFNVIDNESGFKIDFMVKKHGAYRDAEFSRRRRDIVYESEAWVVSAEDLLLSKLIWMQESESGVQKVDIQRIVADNDLDMPYVRHWINLLNLKTFSLL